MTRITRSDHIIVLLRQKLERAAELKKKQKSAAAGQASASDAATGMQRMRALAQLDALDEEEVERSIVHGLLLEQFGEAVVNDPQFQRLVSRVTDMLKTDDAARAILSAAKRELRE